MDWLDKLVDGFKFSESPSRYYWWSGAAAISAVLRRNVLLNRHSYKLYPNINVAIVSARSGLRKGAPIAIVKDLLEAAACTRIISGCNSVQGIIKELSTQETLENGKVIDKAHGILLSDEFKSFLTEDDSALTLLTALHNTGEHKRQWKKTLRNSAPEVLKEPCLTLLIASNEALFNTMVKSFDIEGGFIARTFIVLESIAGKANALVRKPEFLLDMDTAAQELHQMGQVEGEFIWDEEAGTRYEKWYEALHASLSEIADRTGTMDRLGDQVLKLAMILAIAKGAGQNDQPLVLDLDVINRAIDKAESCIPAVHRIAMSGATGNQDMDHAIPKIMRILLATPDMMMQRNRLIQRSGLEPFTFEKAIRTMIEHEAIEGPMRIGDKLVYKLTTTAAKLYFQNIEEST